MMSDEPEEISGAGDEKADVIGRDFGDIEAVGRSSKDRRRTDDATDLQMKRTVSFQPGHYKRSRAMRRTRSRSSTIDSIDTDDTDDSEFDITLDDDDDDDDDGTSTIMTDASDVTEDDLDDEAVTSKGRFTPSFVAKRRARRRRRKAREAREGKGGPKKVYRRTPVLSGVIAPFSIMLEIPGFTSRWYVRTDPVTNELVYKANPIILDVGLALSLTCAIIANLAILARFAERLPPRKATLIAAGFLIGHDIINAVALVVFGVVHAVNDGYTYSEAYWMTTAATAASLICTASLVFDYLSTKNFKYAGSGLTPKQAQLVMVIMAFLAYLSVSAMIYALIQSLPFLTSMYFMVETLATIGLGDFSPTSTGGRIALFFIAPGGIVLLAVVIGIARQTILEEFEAAYKRRKALFRQKAAEKKAEKKKNRHLAVHIKKSGGRGGGRGGGPAIPLSQLPDLASMANSIPKDHAVVQEPTPPAFLPGGGRWFGGSWTSGFARRGSNVPKAITRRSSTDSEAQLDEKSGAKPGTALQRSDTMTTTASQLKEYEAMLSHHRKDIEESFKKFRVELARQERNEFWTKLSVAAGLFACFWLLGGAIFSQLEGWTYFQGFYFVFVVFTTIGYGDFLPKTNAGRAFFIVWALFGVATLTILFSVVSDAWANKVQQAKLAGVAVEKKPSLWSKMSKKVKGNRGKDGFDTDGETDEESVRSKGSNASKPVSFIDGEKGKENGNAVGEVDCDAKGGGILMEPGTTVQTSPSTASSIDEEEDDIDINQLHLDFTTTAMEFHSSALDLYHQNAQSITQTFSHVPEVQEVISKQAGGDKRKVTEKERTKMLDAVREENDPKAVQSIQQWLSIQDCEHYLHSLVERSARFEKEIAKREAALQEAQDELEKLRAQESQQEDTPSPVDSAEGIALLPEQKQEDSP